MMSDEHLDYYRSVYIRYAPALIRFAGKFVASGAEDLIHDVFLKLWNSHVLYLPKDELSRVLFTSVRNACIDQLRRINLETGVLDRERQLQMDELAFSENMEDTFMKKDIMEVLMQKIDELPEKSREIFRLSYIEGLKASEIAEKQGVSVRTVENQLYRTLLTLRKHFSHFIMLIGPILLVHIKTLIRPDHTQKK